MLQRTITGGILLIAMIVLFFFGGLPLKIAIFLLSMVGIYELFQAISRPLEAIHYLTMGVTVFYYLIIDISTIENPLFIGMVLLLLVHLMSLVIQYDQVTIEKMVKSIFGFLYVPVLFSSLWLIRREPMGEYFIWLVFIAAWGTDVGAYCFGKLFGKHKLIPKISPNKTIEGSIGGVFTAGLLAFLYGFWVIEILGSSISHIPEHQVVLACVVMGILGSLLAQLGDLSASAMKRFTGIKDYGSIFPGHGGVLDRFDSILFTAPAIYVVISLFNLYGR